MSFNINESPIKFVGTIAVHTGNNVCRKFLYSQGLNTTIETKISRTGLAFGAVGVGLFAYYLYQIWDTSNRLSESSSTTNPATVNNNQPTTLAPVPFCSICHTDNSTIYCMKDGHGFCKDCINSYAKTSFQDMGSYCRLVKSSTSNISSNIGELPCPFFERNGCICSNIMLANIDWQNDTFLSFKNAERRIGILEAEADHQRQTLFHNDSNSDLSGLMVVAVQSVLSIGASVSCPNCSYRGEKDDACMHIVCTNCCCSWCYCCGRRRNIIGLNVCTTCNQGGVYIQYHPGWNVYQVEQSESRGYAALHEFHRKRMAYFLRRLVEGVPDLPWSTFWIRNQQTLLTQVPTPNRRITLNDIAIATPPSFGSTTVNQLQWLKDCQPIIDKLREQIRRRSNLNQNRRPTVLDEEIRAQIEHVLDNLSNDRDLQIGLLESMLQAQHDQHHWKEQVNHSFGYRTLFGPCSDEFLRLCFKI
jgi:hypothetical protein